MDCELDVAGDEKKRRTEKAKARSDALHAAGKCIVCAKDYTGECKTCPECRDKRNALRKNRIASGLCGVCSEPVEEGKATCEACLRKERLYFEERKKNRICRCCRKPLTDEEKIECKKCVDRAAERRVVRHQELKEEVMHAVGGCRCKVCGVNVIDMLTIDHINNDGATHRKEVGGGHEIYRWLKRNGYPEGYQVLCYNCNVGKYLLGREPTVAEVYGGILAMFSPDSIVEIDGKQYIPISLFTGDVDANKE